MVSIWLPPVGLEPTTTDGQKYGRLARLERIAILPISSCQQTFFFRHRRRKLADQLTASAVSMSLVGLILTKGKEKRPPNGDLFLWLPLLDLNASKLLFFNTFWCLSCNKVAIGFLNFVSKNLCEKYSHINFDKKTPQPVR